MRDLLRLTINFVDEQFDKEIPHFVRTLYWAQQFGDKDDLGLQVAAYSHDIQRSTIDKTDTLKKLKSVRDGFLDIEFLERHQIEGAKIMKNFLLENGVDEQLVEDVYRLISNHEHGGDNRQNILKDADSVSFFECNIDNFVKEYSQIVGKKKVRAKIDWMYNRISSDKARAIAKPYYDLAIKSL